MTGLGTWLGCRTEGTMATKKRKAIPKKRKPVVHRTPATGVDPTKRVGQKRLAAVNKEPLIKKPPKETFMVSKGDSADPANPEMKPTKGYRINDYLAATRALGDDGWHITHLLTGCKLTGKVLKSANKALEIGMKILEVDIPWHRVTYKNFHKVASEKKRNKVREIISEAQDG